jgi:hypothetical protein
MSFKLKTAKAYLFIFSLKQFLNNLSLNLNNQLFILNK